MGPAKNGHAGLRSAPHNPAGLRPGLRPVRAGGHRRAHPAAARAFEWQRILDEGVCGTIEEPAKRERVNRGYMSLVLRLTLLAPDIVDAILDGRQPADILEGFPLELDSDDLTSGAARRSVSFSLAKLNAEQPPSPQPRRACISNRGWRRDPAGPWLSAPGRRRPRASLSAAREPERTFDRLRTRSRTTWSCHNGKSIGEEGFAAEIAGSESQHHLAVVTSQGTQHWYACRDLGTDLECRDAEPIDDRAGGLPTRNDQSTHTPLHQTLGDRRKGLLDGVTDRLASVAGLEPGNHLRWPAAGD